MDINDFKQFIQSKISYAKGKSREVNFFAEKQYQVGRMEAFMEVLDYIETPSVNSPNAREAKARNDQRLKDIEGMSGL